MQNRFDPSPLIHQVTEFLDSAGLSPAAKRRAALDDVFYEHLADVYWTLSDRGDYIKMTATSVRRLIKSRGFRPTTGDDEVVSPLDRAILHVQRHNDVVYAGPVAGWMKGDKSLLSKRILVTESPTLIEPKSGEWPCLEKFLATLLGGGEPDQLPFFYGWAKTAVEALQSGVHCPGQVLVLGGPTGFGKSLLQNLLTEMLGGQVARPFQYMTGATPFNGELFDAVHQMIEDEVSSRDMRGRRHFGTMVKNMIVNEVQRCHMKYVQALSLRPLWRVTVSLNDKPEDILVLPPLDESLEDKFILFKVSKGVRPDLPREQVWRRLVGELPQFIKFLNDWEIPTAIRCERYGVTHYHQPELLAALSELAPEPRLLSLIDAVLFSTPADRLDSWEGLAIDLERRLLDSNLAAEARALFGFTNACATFLGRLERSHPNRVSSRRLKGRTMWLISADLSPDEDKKAAEQKILDLHRRCPESRRIIRKLYPNPKHKKVDMATTAEYDAAVGDEATPPDSQGTGLLPPGNGGLPPKCEDLPPSTGDHCDPS